jgi:hypothetical protein
LATSLIDELQLDAASGNVPVADLLRKALMVASKLQVTDIPVWINRELSGYAADEEIPPHRILYGRMMIQTYQGWIPVQFPTNSSEETFTRQPIGNPIAAIEALIMSGDGELRSEFPAEALKLLQHMFQRQTEFCLVLDRPSFQGIISEIRNQVLRWAIALDKAGVRGQGLSFTGPEKQIAHSMMFRTDSGSITIGVAGNVGGQANVATGLHSRAGAIDADDVRRLLVEIETHAANLQLQQTDKHELQAALAELQMDSAKPPEPGKVRQALTRVLTVIGKAGETVLTAGIRAYTEAWMKQHGMAP